MVGMIGVCDDIAGVTVTVIIATAVGCSDGPGVAALFMTEIVGRGGDRALTVNMSMVAPTLGAV